MIRLKNARGFTVAGNLIEFRGQASERGPVGIAIEDCTAGTVSANVVTGDCGVGLQLAGQLPGVVVSGNSLATSELRDESQGTARVE